MEKELKKPEQLTQEDLDEIDNLDDFDLDETVPTYEIWLLGNDKDGVATDLDELLDDGYTSLTEAKKCWDYLDCGDHLKEAIKAKGIKLPEDVETVFLVLEEVIMEDEFTFTCIDKVKEDSFNIECLLEDWYE